MADQPSDRVRTERTDGVTLKLSWKYVIAFLALTVLMGTSHEFAHHFSAAAICGEFGFKTFNSFEVAPGCEQNRWSLLATAAGPAFTFALMWWGAALLRRDAVGRRQLGFALIFANFPINRLLFVLLYANDEHWLATKLFGPTEIVHWLTVMITWLIALPPVIWGYRAIRNARRVLWFSGFFVLPFLFVVIFAGFFLEDYLLLRAGVLDSSVIGIPLLIMLVEVLSLVLWLAFRRHVIGPSGEGPIARGGH